MYNQTSYKRNIMRNIKEKVICLNPNCKSSKKIFYLQDIDLNQSLLSEQHIQCESWVKTLQYLQIFQDEKAQGSCQFIGFTDYLQSPIDSIYYMNDFATKDWKSSLSNIFDNIRANIEGQLLEVYENCTKKIEQHLNHNRYILRKINRFCSEVRQQWTVRVEEAFENDLSNDLRNLAQSGRLNILDNQVLLNQVEKIKKEIQRIDWIIWNKQSDYSLIKRTLSFNNRTQLEKIQQESNMEFINKKLQQIHSTLKLPNFSFNEHMGTTTLSCGVCQHLMSSNANNNRLKRNQCLTKLLRHICSTHKQLLVLKCLNKQNKISKMLSFQQFLRQIYSMPIHTFVIVDRQNINANVQIQFTEGIYYLQVVGKNKENIASERFLVADSTGKDAADILIIIVLYQIIKLGKREIILLTNDHFGKTLQPILRKFGAHIKLSNKADFSINKDNSMMQEEEMIEVIEID